MNKAQIFNEFHDNLKISNYETISSKYRRITKILNKTFRNTESETANTLQVGSIGRNTAIVGISDLDMIYEMPKHDFKKYHSRKFNGQSDLLQDIKKAIIQTYPRTDVRGDGQVVVVSFENYKVEICPAFIKEDGDYFHPDSHNGGSWQTTKPRHEIEAFKTMNDKSKGNFRILAKMCRAWKNKNGVKISGFLIDILCYNFFVDNETHFNTTFSNYDILLQDFFDFLQTKDKTQKYYIAPGSRQRAYSKGNFVAKAKKAYEKIHEARQKNENKTVYGIWRKVFGIHFPYPKDILTKSLNFTATEQFIEHLYPVDIRANLKIDCLVTQTGFRNAYLSQLPVLKINKRLKFLIKKNSAIAPYQVKWKVKNKGNEAKRRSNFRGQIIDDLGKETKVETSNFKGEHYVECYIIKDNVCIARDRIDVPISI